MDGYEESLEIEKATVIECEKKCLDLTKFYCKSFNYNSKKEQCELFDSSENDNTAEVSEETEDQKNEGLIYYERVLDDDV